MFILLRPWGSIAAPLPARAGSTPRKADLVEKGPIIAELPNRVIGQLFSISRFRSYPITQSGDSRKTRVVPPGLCRFYRSGTQGCRPGLPALAPAGLNARVVVRSHASKTGQGGPQYDHSYFEYNSTMSCSLTGRFTSSRLGNTVRRPFMFSRSISSQFGAG